ncbi:hypothetical protein ACIRFH_34610 [Streptomyces sp. NPDC093586]|uniref:hypothetical protein n=1 Tax=Streptomyces sp. NPDC093586 TaxID=3366042 RepID=UPI00381BFB14
MDEGYSLLLRLPELYFFCRARLQEESLAGDTQARVLLGELGEAVHTVRAACPLSPGGLSVREAEQRLRAISDRYLAHPDHPLAAKEVPAAGAEGDRPG